jgi:NIMA (never in mitosis gene a)-related kinase 1/4/5
MDTKQRNDSVNEIQVLKSLKNPFIVTYYESFVEKKYDRFT